MTSRRDKVLVAMSWLQMPCSVLRELWFMECINILTAKGKETTMVNRLNPDSMSLGVEGDLPFLPASVLVFGSEHSPFSVGTQHFIIVGPRCNDKVPSVAIFDESPYFPAFPVLVRLQMSKHVAIHATIMLGMRNETQLIPCLLHAWQTERELHDDRVFCV